EVVESFKEKYIAAAKKTPAALLISALNILNETEINYKAARNKRLHVELALIKLCYLQQALELTADAGNISKKKLVETARSVAFRQIAPIEMKKPGGGSQESGISPTGRQVKSKETEEKLIIETTDSRNINVAEEEVAYGKQPANYEQPITNPERQTKGSQPVTGNKISALGKIRQQYQGNGTAANGAINQSLQLELLQKAWAEYVVKLKEERNPAAQPFELALLRVKDENCFEVITANNIEQKFIEQERNKLFAFLQQQLQNRLLQFNVAVEEKTQDRPVIELSLTAKEQFQKMAEEYPLVKELRDRLKLDLDY
ncbi:MAG TPA: DNA polymerase III subunit gamma/tau, partial [Chitinophagaceae bacterium]